MELLALLQDSRSSQELLPGELHFFLKDTCVEFFARHEQDGYLFNVSSTMDFECTCPGVPCFMQILCSAFNSFLSSDVLK